MIIENVKITNNHRIKVTRVCDHCGKKEKTHLGIIYGGRMSRENNKDYCKKCSYIYRNLSHPKMEKSPSWNGGRYMSENGYYRVYVGNLKYEYEHKIILSQHLKRSLSTEEKVHHIDCNKANNAIDNLYLVANKKEHWALHQSLEDCAFEMFNKYLWLDNKKKLYTLEYCKRKKINIDMSDLMLYNTYQESRRINGKKYLRFTSRRDAKTLGSTLLHVVIAERIMGRELSKREVVHHIDGNTLNNDPSNLCVMDRGQHKKCHYSLQSCCATLLQQNVVKFSEGKYYV